MNKFIIKLMNELRFLVLCVLNVLLRIYLAFCGMMIMLDFSNYEDIKWTYYIFNELPIKKMLLGALVYGTVLWWVKTAKADKNQSK